MCKNCLTCVREVIRQAKFGYKRDAQGKIIQQITRTPMQAKIQGLLEQRRLALFGYMRDGNGQITNAMHPAVLQASESPQCPACLCPIGEHVI